MKRLIVAVSFLLLVAQADASLRLIVHIQSVTFQGNQIVVDFIVQPIGGGPVQRTTQQTLASNVTAANFEAGIKNLIITYASNQYGLTLVADEILLGWGGQ